MDTELEKEQYRKLFQEHFGKVQPLWPVDSLLFIIALVGLVLNGLLLFVTYRRKRPRAVDIMLIGIIALFDIIWCSALLVSLTLRWFLGNEILSEDSKLCQFSAITFNASFICTVICTSLLALARYLAIVLKLSLSNRNWMGLTILLVSIVWIFFIQRGFTELLFVMPAGFYCMPQIFGSSWLSELFKIGMLSLLYPSYLLIPICYTLITLYYRRQLILLNPMKPQGLTSKLSRGTLQLLIFLFAYSIAIFPDAIHVILSTYYNVKRTALSDGIVMSLEFTLSSTNAIFALLLHDELHQEFRVLIGVYKGQSSFSYEI